MFNSSVGFNLGFRILGSCSNDRGLVDWPKAFLAYSQCDAKAEVSREAYLSAFMFDDEFRAWLVATRSTRNFSGKCWSAYLWFDIDREEIEAATADARRLVATLLESFAVSGDEIIVFFSGSKGFHIGLPTSLWNPDPSTTFHAYSRTFAEAIAAVANVSIDTGIYDRVRAFRAPNSRHARTGRFKRFLSLHELMALKPARIVELASEPVQFDIPCSPKVDSRAVREWNAAIDVVDTQQSVLVGRRNACLIPSSLNRSTLEFIRQGATKGDRHRKLFSAAANLAEFGCSSELAFALLAESALDRRNVTIGSSSAN